MKHSLVNLRRTILISFGLFVLLLSVAYLCIAQYYKKHFGARTVINGVDCSNLTTDEANAVITTKMTSYTLGIITRDGDRQSVDGRSFGLTCTFDKEMEGKLKEQSPYAWFPNAFKEEQITIPYQITYDEKQLDTLVDHLPCMKDEKQTSPVNACISAYEGDKGFSIKKEQLGRKVRKERVKEEVRQAVHRMKPELSLEEAGCYERPQITSGDKELSNTLTVIQTYMQTELTYSFGSVTEVFDKRRIGPAIKVDCGNKVSLDEKAIDAFVEELSQKYSREFEKKRFQTSYGKIVEIRTENCGPILDKGKEKEEILACIKKGERKKKTPVILEAAKSLCADKFGGTYVEINLAKQQLFVYYEGKNVIESALVSGSIKGGHTTPTGIYFVQTKERSRYLEGPDDDGSRYRSYVNYWMPFNGGIGLHDATWRHGKFGGTIYKMRGSHGCINLPLEKAKAVYETIAKGTPVIVYELEDTK